MAGSLEASTCADDKAWIADTFDQSFGSTKVVVGDHHRVDELPTGGDQRESGTDPTGSDEQHSHAWPSWAAGP